MIGGLQGEFGDLDIKYLKQNISKCRWHISGSFRRTLRHYAKYLRKSPGKRYRWIRICLTEEVETPSFPIRICLPNVKYPEKMEHRKRDRPRVHGVGTPSPDDTEHALLSGATPSGFPKRTRAAMLSRFPQGEAHDTREHHTRTIAYPIQICCPDGKH